MYICTYTRMFRALLENVDDLIAAEIHIHTFTYVRIYVYSGLFWGILMTLLLPRFIYIHSHMYVYTSFREVGGWGRVPFSRNLMSPTPRRKWYLTTGRRFH